MNKVLYGLEPAPDWDDMTDMNLKSMSISQTTPHSIPHNLIYQLIEDVQNNIWILTDKGEWHVISGKADDFLIPTDETGNNIIAYSVCRLMMECYSVRKIKSFSIIIGMPLSASCKRLT